MHTEVPANHPRQQAHHVQRTMLATALLALPAIASAQCEWETLGSGEPGSGPGNRSVVAITEFQGQVYVGGRFREAGGVPGTRGITRWNGVEWESVGGGVVGVNGVNVLTAIDDELWVGGNFSTAGGLGGTTGIAKWNGEWWSSVGGGFADYGVYSIVEFDGDVYACGKFNQLSSSPPPKFVARWDGVSWSQVGDIGAPFGEIVFDLIVFDDGSGPALYAATTFPVGDDSRVAKWNGEDWTPVGGNIVGEDIRVRVERFAVFEGDLYACGNFEQTDEQPGTAGIARWDGERWVSVGGGITSGDAEERLYTMEVFDDGSGPALYVAGEMTSMGGVAVSNLAKWDGRSWSAPASGGLDDIVFDLTSIDGDLYAGGDFATAGGIAADQIARMACDGSACYADLDGDGELTIFDFLAFQNAFDAGDTVADCDADGDLTLFDFLCFQNAFDAGCK